MLYWKLSVGVLAFAVFASAVPGGVGHSLAASGPIDEAQLAGRSEASFPQASEDFFHEMDNGVQLTPEEVQGRNMWLVWTGGNDRFWDRVTKNSLATFDLLKIVTSHPSQTYCNGQHCDRDSRWRWLGAINEPCFEKPAAPDPQRFGLWLDVRSANCAADPFEDETKYPGVKINARGTTFSDGSKLPVGSYFGYDTGILGLRLFPNPDFDPGRQGQMGSGARSPPTRTTTKTPISFGRTGSAWRAASATSDRVRFTPPADPAHPHWG